MVDIGRFGVTGDERDKHVFKVPGLRNVAVTAPYFHDGSVTTSKARLGSWAAISSDAS